MIYLTRTDTKKYTEKTGINTKPTHNESNNKQGANKVRFGSVVECHT